MKAISSRATKRGQRGIALVMALFVTGLLLVVGMLLLDNVLSVATNVVDVKQKNQIFDAAEAGLNSALDLLDRQPNADAFTSCPGGTVQGYNFTCGIKNNNFFGAFAQSVTGFSSPVPVGMALIYGRSANAASQRAVEIDALVTLQTSNLSLPPGAINANRDVSGSTQSKINGDVTDLANPNDADIHANQNISQFETRSGNIQGKTYAVSTDAQPGIDNQTHSNQPPVTFPSTSTAQSFANAAASKARAGTYLTAAQFIANGTSTYAGDVYVDGNVDMTQNAVTFAGGGTVYFNGSLCMSGQSSIINAASSTVVIKNEYAVSGNAGAYSTAPATRGVLVVMGSDIAPPCTGGTQAVAVNFSGNADSRIGVVYAPNGTVQLAGNGALTGAIDAGVDVLFNGSPGGSFTYDHNLSNVVLGTPTYVKITAYAEN